MSTPSSRNHPNQPGAGLCATWGYDLAGLTAGICPECGNAAVATGPEPSRGARLAFAASIAAVAIGLGALSLFGWTVLRPWAPLPLTAILPVFYLDTILAWPVLLAPFAIVCGVACWVAKDRLPWWSWVPAAGILSCSWYMEYPTGFAWNYHGATYVVVCTAVNAIVTVSLLWLWLRSRQRRSFRTVVAFHALLACWVATYAFAYMWELP